MGTEESKERQRVEVSPSMLNKITNQEFKRDLWKAERDSVKKLRDEKDKELEFFKRRVARLEEQLKSNNPQQPQSIITNITKNDVTIAPFDLPEANSN